jgi:hypothetical protein
MTTKYTKIAEMLADVYAQRNQKFADDDDTWSSPSAGIGAAVLYNKGRSLGNAAAFPFRPRHDYRDALKDVSSIVGDKDKGPMADMIRRLPLRSNRNLSHTFRNILVDVSRRLPALTWRSWLKEKARISRLPTDSAIATNFKHLLSQHGVILPRSVSSTDFIKNFKSLLAKNNIPIPPGTPDASLVSKFKSLLANRGVTVATPMSDASIVEHLSKTLTDRASQLNALKTKVPISGAAAALKNTGRMGRAGKMLAKGVIPYYLGGYVAPSAFQYMVGAKKK